MTIFDSKKQNPVNPSLQLSKDKEKKGKNSLLNKTSKSSLKNSKTYFNNSSTSLKSVKNSPSPQKSLTKGLKKH